MKQILILILFVIATAWVGFSQTKDKRTEKFIEEIKQMDRQWQVESYSRKDLKDYDRIVADDFLITGSNGKTITKAEKRASVAADYTEPSPDAVFKIDETSAL